MVTYITCNSELVLITVEKYGPQLRSYFYNRLRSYNDVDDLLQELYCRVLTYRNNVNVDSIKSFVFTIALNLIRDKSRRNYTRMIEKSDTIECDSDIPIYNPIIDPLRIVEGVEALSQLAETLETLSPSCKTAFYLHRIRGLSYVNIADTMGVSVSMVEKYLMTAIKKLRVNND